MDEVLGAQGGLVDGRACCWIISMMRGECVNGGSFACSVSMAWVVVMCQETGWLSEDGSEACSWHSLAGSLQRRCPISLGLN